MTKHTIDLLASIGRIGGFLLGCDSCSGKGYQVHYEEVYVGDLVSSMCPMSSEPCTCLLGKMVDMEVGGQGVIPSFLRFIVDVSLVIKVKLLSITTKCKDCEGSGYTYRYQSLIEKKICKGCEAGRAESVVMKWKGVF